VLSHVLHGSPVLTLRVVAGKSAPKVRVLAITLPRGLRFVLLRGHRSAVTVRLRGARLATGRVGRRFLVIALRRAASGVTVQVRGISETDNFSDAAERHRLKRPRIGVEAIDAHGLPTVLRALVRVLRF
jgi:hypothetical protein